MTFNSLFHEEIHLLEISNIPNCLIFAYINFIGASVHLLSVSGEKEKIPYIYSRLVEMYSPIPAEQYNGALENINIESQLNVFEKMLNSISATVKDYGDFSLKFDVQPVIGSIMDILSELSHLLGVSNGDDVNILKINTLLGVAVDIFNQCNLPRK